MRCGILLAKEKIARINELAQKAKSAIGLSDAEVVERDQLRKEYLASFRSTMTDTITSLKIVDPEGTDVTPERIKKLKEKNQLH